MKELPSYRHIWKIAYPIILSLLAQNVVNVIDTAFLGRVGEVELGAAAIAIIFYVVLYMLGFGFSIGAQILMARRNGEGNTKEVGNIMDHSLYFMFGMSVFLFVIIKYFSPQMLRPFIASDEIFNASVTYMQYRIYGVFFAFFNVMSRAFYVSITRTRLLAGSAIIMAVVNVVLDYVMIFGHWGFPQMGIAGAAIASAIAEGCSALFFLVYTIRLTDRSKYNLFRFPKPNFGVIKKTLDISVFVMIQYFLSLSAWFIFFIIIEKMGERSLAVSNIIRSLYMVMMMPVWAFSSTTNTLVSNAIGQGKRNLVLPIIRKISYITLFSVVLLLIPMLFIPGWLIRVYTPDITLIADTIPSLYVIFGAMLLFAAGQNMFSGVSGTGNTRDALVIEGITLIIYLVFTWLIAIRWQQPITVVWFCEYIYFALLGIFSFLYLRSKRWQRKVI
ncbi:MAG: MATE family efflux transporter [Bacteroidales bacterium]|nr:MATE family efflux transporter [Bacteroidales bacterium]MDZ4205041.1 MATE family efflux transporter [Bacteroidales bacterium]